MSLTNLGKKKSTSGKGGSSGSGNIQNTRPSSSTGKGGGSTSGGNIANTRPSGGSSSSSSSGKGSGSSGGNISSGFTRPVSENRPSSGSSSIGKGGGSSSSSSSSKGSSSSSSGSSSSIGKGSSKPSGNIIGNWTNSSSSAPNNSTGSGTTSNELVEESFTSFYPSYGSPNPSTTTPQPDNSAAYEQYLAELERMEQERKAEQERLEAEERRRLEEAQEAERQKIKAQTDAAVSQIEGQRPDIHRYAEEAARQAYINKMIAQRDLPQQLAATGSSGGLTDSAVLALNAGYENSHNSILENQNAALNELDSRIAQVKANQNFSLADAESQYQQQLAQQLAAERSKRQDFQNQMDLLAYQARLDAQSAGGRSGSSRSAGSTNGSTGKPRLSFNQLQELYDGGDTSADVVDGINYYRPGYLAGSQASGRLNTIKQYIDATAGVAEGMGVSSQAMAKSTIEQAVRRGQLSAAEARQLAAMYGVTLTGI